MWCIWFSLILLFVFMICFWGCQCYGIDITIVSNSDNASRLRASCLVRADWHGHWRLTHRDGCTNPQINFGTTATLFGTTANPLNRKQTDGNDTTANGTKKIWRHHTILINQWNGLVVLHDETWCPQPGGMVTATDNRIINSTTMTTILKQLMNIKQK